MERINVKGVDLDQLVADLDDMERYLKRKIGKMDGLVEKIGTRWRGDTARAYRDLQKGVTEDARAVRRALILIEEAVKLGRDGFSDQDIDVLEQMTQLQRSAEGREELLGMADANPVAGLPKSKLDEL
ncbi:WXG100 family type VII secretion target [Streptomyces sp. NPDC048172]|uniref:WXG100 family type VII secretion target n=1 Tax=Streptomyces sp. NPDC048172 TaxID=3365505 RepID=UPI00372174A3